MARIKPQALLQQSKKKKGPARISVTTIILCNLIVVLIVFFVFATYRHWSQRFVKFFICARVYIFILTKWDSFLENGIEEQFGICRNI
jgi:ABC-type phosphate transport system permease subunit